VFGIWCDCQHFTVVELLLGVCACVCSQARAPNSPVIIVGTHYDKLSRSDKHELARCLNYITNQYGQLDAAIGKKEGFPQVRGEGPGGCGFLFLFGLRGSVWM